MPKNYGEMPPDAVRRPDREVTDQTWIRDFLHRATTGYLATVYEDQPFINSNLYVYDEANSRIYMHTARVGRTRANIETSEKVCFSISEVGRMLPADEALEFSVEYSGVVIFGSACVVTDADEQRHGLQLLLDKYFSHLRPGEHYRPIDDSELVRTSVYRIDIERWTGKQKKAEADFHGAFLYQENRRDESNPLP